MKKLLTLAIATFFSQNFLHAQTATLSEPLQSFSILSGTSISSVQTTNVAGAVGAIGTVDTTVISRDTTLRGSICVTQRALDSFNLVRNRLRQMPMQTPTANTMSNTSLTAGTYHTNSSLTMSGTITLTGDSTSQFIFNVDGSLQFASRTQLVLNGDINPENIFFNVDSSVRVGDSSVVCGNILADGTICCQHDIYASGTRLMSRDSVCLINTRDTIGITPDDRLAVFGSSCECAVDLGQGDTCANNITMTDSVMWFRFVANSAAKTLNLSSTDASFLNIEVYSGICSGLNVITNTNLRSSDSISKSLSVFELTLGNTYLVKIIKGVQNNSIIDICLQGFREILHVNGMPCQYPHQSCGPETLCPVTQICPGTPVDFCTFTTTTAVAFAPWAINDPTCTGGYIQWTFPGSNIPSVIISDATNTTPGQDICFSPQWFTTGTYNVSVKYFNPLCNDCKTPPFDFYEWIVPVTIVGPDVSIVSNFAQICSGGSLQLTANATATNPPISYLWSNGQTTPSIIITAAGTYNVTVTDGTYGLDGNPCTNFATINVTLVPSTVNANFSINPNSLLCMGQGINFLDNTAGGTPPYTYAWNFGDGNTSTQQNPSNTYNLSGNYWVTLTATDANGCPATSTQQITIAPASSCCAFTISYHDALAIFNSPITNSTTLTPHPTGGIYRINKTIFIQAPAVWTIPANQIIEFGPLGKIIVENGTGVGPNAAGAQLVMNLKSRFTSVTNSFPSCPVMWPGVEVWGVSDNGPVNSSGQGKITMGLFSTIENAHIGVFLGKPSTCIPAPLVKCAFWDIGNGGGIINANGSIFNNNATSVQFYPYNKYNNFSIIQNCQFTGGFVSQLDPGYISSNPSYTYPNANNPYYTSTSNGLSPRLIYMWGVKNVNIWDNTFSTLAWNGIELYNARSIIMKNTDPDGNVFDDLAYGIRASYYNSSIFGNWIEKNTFEDVFTVSIEGGNGDQILTNTFHRPSQTPSANTFPGLYMFLSNNFSITDNMFFLWDAGVLAQASVSPFSPSTGLIGFSQIGNTFTECKKSIFTIGNNGGVQVKCNQYNNPVSANYVVNWDITPSNLFYFPDQGNLPVTSAFDPAGNQFNFPTRKQLNSNLPFTYYRHQSSTVCGQCITPVPTNTNITVSSQPFTHTATSCIDPCSVPNPPCRIAQMNNLTNRISGLQIEFNNVLANLDKGQTAQLLSAINGNTNAGQLKNMLLNNSPLSDEVLITFINKNGTPPGHFKEVMIPNSPVTNDVRPALLAKLASLPKGIANQIRDAQGSSAYRTLTTISREILSAQNQRQLSLNDLVAQFVTMDSTDAAISLLEAENTVDADQILVATYLEQGMFNEVENKLNSMDGSIPERQAFIDLHLMLLELSQDSLTVFDMDAAQEALVRSIAAMPLSLAVVNALAILKQVFNEDFIVPPSSARMQEQIINSQGELSETNYLGENHPNPFSEKTFIPYYLPENSGGFIKIYDVKGRLINSFLLSEGNNFIEVDTQNWTYGMYIYSMEIDGVKIQHRKMAVIK